MMKPRILLVALLSNLVIFGGVKAYRYWRNAPVMLWLVEKNQRALARPSALAYPDSSSSDTRLEMTPAFASIGKLEVVWTKQLDSASFRGAVLSGDAAFVGTDSGLIHEINPEDGEIRRSFYLGTAVSAAPCVFQGALYAGEGKHDTHHARLYKFDLSSGALVGVSATAGHIEGNPVAVKGSTVQAILVPSGKDGLTVIDSQTLKSLWHTGDGHVDASARAVGDVLFSGTGIEKENHRGKRGAAISYELATGKKLWQRELPGSSWMQPIAWQDKICFVFGEVYFQSDLGGFYCFRQSDGLPDVAYNNGAPIVATPILVGDDLVVSDLKGKVCRVSLRDGLAKWCQETAEAKHAFANPVYDSTAGVLIYPSQSEGLFVLDPNDGKILSKWKAEGETLSWTKTYAPATVTKNGWIIVDMKGVMRKLRWRSELRNVPEYPQASQ